MKDEEIEKLVLTHQSSSICYCHTKGKAACKQHKALLGLARRIASKARDEGLERAAEEASWVMADGTDLNAYCDKIVGRIRALKAGSVEVG